MALDKVGVVEVPLGVEDDGTPSGAELEAEPGRVADLAADADLRGGVGREKQDEEEEAHRSGGSVPVGREEGPQRTARP